MKRLDVGQDDSSGSRLGWARLWLWLQGVRCRCSFRIEAIWWAKCSNASEATRINLAMSTEDSRDVSIRGARNVVE
jgi:hypothetical protein